MSYRKIQPSSATEGSSSTSNPSLLTNTSTSESVKSEPTQQNLSPAKSEIGAPSSTSKRRRVPESVTRNACLSCKKARAKCDGKKPCTRCQTRVDSSNCIYEIHIKHAKEELVKQIKQLKAKDHLVDQIFQALSLNEQTTEILTRIQHGDSNESIVEYLGRGSMMEDEGTVSPRDSLKSGFGTADQEMSGVSANVRSQGYHRWSTVTDDVAIFHHLFQLYFSWVHPVHTLFNEGHFVGCYNTPSETYCSAALVNAICAMACHLHTHRDTDELNFEQLGHRFSDAARSTLDPTSQTITTAEAFAILSLIDLARGRSSRAATYLKIANQIALSLARREENRPPDALLHTLRGLRNMTIEWTLMTFQVLPLSSSTVPNPEDELEHHLDEAHWYYYRDPNDQCPSWPCLLSTTNREKSKLMDIISEMNDMYYSAAPQVIHAHAALALYTRLIEWRKGLAKILGNIEENQAQALPHVLSMLILHSVAVVHLLWPLINVPLDSPTQIPYIRQAIWRHAQEGLHLLNDRYRMQFTTRYQPVVQIFATLHFCDVIIRFFPNVKTVGSEAPRKDGAQALQIGLETLMVCHKGFPIAGPLQELLRRTAVEHSIQVPHDIEKLTAPPRPPYDTYTIDDFIEACAGTTYVQPTAEIQRRCLPTFARDWIAQVNRQGPPELAPIGTADIHTEEERGAQSLMQIRNLLNVG